MHVALKQLTADHLLDKLFSLFLKPSSHASLQGLCQRVHQLEHTAVCLPSNAVVECTDTDCVTC